MSKFFTKTTASDRFLQDYQRDFPLVPEPYDAIAAELGASAYDVRAVCEALINSGVIARIGGVVRPNTISASTLAAVRIPELAVDAIAGKISALEGVNHVYLRENPINIWFVATGPDRNYIDRTLEQVERLAGQQVLDLRLEQPFHIDLGFALTGTPEAHHSATPPVCRYDAHPQDRHLLQILTTGLPIHPRPFLLAGAAIGLPEEAVIDRLHHMLACGIITRIGAIIRHRALGWRSNAMVVWDVPPDDIEEKGRILASHKGITLCYQRRRIEGHWPYNLYCMIHAKSRDGALRILADANRRASLENMPRQVLFSSRCYKQTGALIVAPKEAA